MVFQVVSYKIFFASVPRDLGTTFSEHRASWRRVENAYKGEIKKI